jgi:hypothetical protein
MRKGKSRRLVIDASVARRAGIGPKAQAADKKYCRAFLRAVVTICHHVAMTDEVLEEWKKHERDFARKWRVGMVARRKQRRGQPSVDNARSKAILATAKSQKQADAMEKDLRLIEAALSSDRIVVSCDKKARKLFSQAALTVPALRRIVWINPTTEPTQAIDWLQRGAPAESGLMLGGK